MRNDTVPPTSNNRASAVTLAGGVVTLAGGFRIDTSGSGLLVCDGSGDDTIYAAAGRFSVTAGSSGSLTFVGSAAVTSVSVSAPDGIGYLASIFGGSGGGGFTGSAGGPNMMVSQGASGILTTLTGASHGDILFGSAGGTDTLSLGQYGGTVVGGGGPTMMTGVSGVFFTGSGPTTVDTETSTQYISPGPLIYGGSDTVVGGSGALNVEAVNGDAIYCGSGAVTIAGSPDFNHPPPFIYTDTVVGGSGSLDYVSAGADLLVVGGTGTSIIGLDAYHSAFNLAESRVFGGAGTMTLNIGAAADTQVLLQTGALIANESHTFGYASHTTYNVIKGEAGGTAVLDGFDTSEDRIALFGYQGPDVHIATTSGSSVLSLVDGTRITLTGVVDTGTSVVFA